MLFKKSLGLIIFFQFLFAAVSYTQQELLYEKHILVKNEDSLPYRKLLPLQFNDTKTYPLVIFLHGSGERGSDNESQLTHGSWLFTKNRDSFPAIILFPQCSQDSYWSSAHVNRASTPVTFEFDYSTEPTAAMDMLMDLVKQYSSKPYIDQKRVYVMGLSMGGMGTFEILHRLPNFFAAAIPICGGGDAAHVSNYATQVPLWIFHGAKDKVVIPEHSLEMVSSILEAGGFPRLTLYDEANHNSWDHAFKEPDLLSWLFSKTKHIH